jgi:hypothetical protein
MLLQFKVSQSKKLKSQSHQRENSLLRRKKSKLELMNKELKNKPRLRWKL